MAMLLQALCLGTAYLFISWVLSFRRQGPPPTPNALTGWKAKFEHLTNSSALLSRTAKRLSPQNFHLTTLRGRMQVYVTSPAVLSELQHLPENIASFTAWTRATLFRDYTLNGHDEYQSAHPEARTAMFRFIRGQLTGRLKDVKWREVDMGEWEGEASEWASTRVAGEVVRVFGGVELSEDPRFVKECVQFAGCIAKGGILGLVPGTVLKKVLGWWIMRGKRDYIEGRIREILGRGNRKDIENTLLEQLLDATTKKGQAPDIYRITNQFLVAIFAAVHTSTLTMTNTLLELSLHPEYHSALRDELRSVLAEHGGWTLDAIRSLKHLDSFMKESQRLRPLTQTAIFRIMLQEHTFSDGTHVLPGDNIATLSGAQLKDAGLYEEPEEFRPWRHVEMAEKGVEGTEMTDTTHPEKWLMFGSGKHACPGRFFASALSKVSVGQMLLKYNIEKADGLGRPENKTFEENEIPVVGRGSKVRFTKLEA